MSALVDKEQLLKNNMTTDQVGDVGREETESSAVLPDGVGGYCPFWCLSTPAWQSCLEMTMLLFGKGRRGQCWLMLDYDSPAPFYALATRPFYSILFYALFRRPWRTSSRSTPR